MRPAPAILLLVLALACSAQAALTRAQSLDLLEQSETAFTEAARQLESDRTRALEGLDRSIALSRRVLEEGGIASGPIHYNIGNAYMLRGDVGRAILEYRRAQSLMRTDADLAANLAYARARVRSRIDPPSDPRAARYLLFWHYDLSPAVRFALFVSSFALVWIVASLRLLRLIGGAGSWAVIAILGSVSAATATSLIVEDRLEGTHRDGVVISTGVVGRQGPDASIYEPTFAEPISAGVEFRLLEQRVGWVLVGLGNDQTTWLPRESIEII